MDKIYLYKLTKNKVQKIKNYFSETNKYIKILEVSSLKDIIRYSYKNSSIVLIESDFLINNELRKMLEDNLITIIRITDKPISLITNFNIFLSLSDEIMNANDLFLDNKITHFEYSMNKLKRMIRTKNNKLLNSIYDIEIQYYNYFELLVKIIYLIDAKDKYTKEHSENVSKYAVLLGKQLNLSDNELELLKIGGLLHDIGKIGIPEKILNKKESLTDSEYALIKKHPIIGETLFPRDSSSEIKKIIRNHHERIDGKGYPDKLKGDEIPLLVRIITIADSFDAMTTQRAYNKRKTLDEAINELYVSSDLKNSNIQFDLNLVENFEKMIRNNDELLKYFNKIDDEIIFERQKQIIKQR